MKSGKGYLLPETLDPPDNVCIAVEIPNSPEYIRAFFGAYEYLGYWFAWQRDELRRGKDAAARWRLAALETHVNWERWGNLCALEINVNCGGGCGCDYTYTPNPDYGQITPEQYEQWVNIPDGLVDDGTNPPTADWGTYEEYQAYKCAAAIRLADDLLETFNRVGLLGGTLATMSIAGATAFVQVGFTSALFGIVAAAVGTFGAVALVLSFIVASFVVSVGYLKFFYDLRQRIDREALICAFYTANNPLAARSSLIEEIQTQFGSVPWGDADPTLAQDFILNLLDYLVPDEIFKTIFGRVIGYDTGTGFDCAACNPEGSLFVMARGTYTGQNVSGNYMFAPDHADLDPVTDGAGNTIVTCERFVTVDFPTPVTLDYLMSDPEPITQTIYTGSQYRIYTGGDTTTPALSRTSSGSVNSSLPYAGVTRVMVQSRNRSTGHSDPFNSLELGITP